MSRPAYAPLKLSANALTLAAGEVDLPTCGVSKRESWHRGNSDRDRDANNLIVGIAATPGHLVYL